jgi:hypothetical protein
MNKIPSDDYSKRLNKRIKDEFEKVLQLPHPCEYQNRNCFNGSECPLIGLPNDTCPHFIRGTCKFDPCRYQHYHQYARIYKQAKEDFRNEERKPLAMIRRYFKLLILYLMVFITIVLNFTKFITFINHLIFYWKLFFEY